MAAFGCDQVPTVKQQHSQDFRDLHRPSLARISHTGAKRCIDLPATARFDHFDARRGLSIASFRFVALARSLRRWLRCSSSQWNNHSSSSCLALGAKPFAIIHDRCEKCGLVLAPMGADKCLGEFEIAVDRAAVQTEHVGDLLATEASEVVQLQHLGAARVL